MSRLALLEQREELEASLIDFFEAAWPHMDPAPYVGGWHLEAIAEHLQAVAEGQIKKLLINVPPRHSKTLITSVAFPAWIWARKPDPDFPLIGPQVKFMCLSYGDQLAMDNATLARRLVASEWYQKLWGDRVKIQADQDAKNKFDTSAGGTRISSSFGGGVLGRGGDIKILDDPHKVDEAESEVTRERVVRAYDGTLKSRVTDPRLSAEIIIMQRLHEGDLSGHVLDSDDDWVHLCLPAEYEPKRHCVTAIGWEDPRTEEGQLLWPERFGEDELKPFKANPYEWAGQWQQSPVTRGGNIFKRDWWQLYQSPDGKFPPFDYVVASLDGAFTEDEENDPSALTVWGLYRDEVAIQMPNGSLVMQKKEPAKIMLIDAWAKHLAIHGTRVEYLPEELEEIQSGDEERRNHALRHYRLRSQKDWGLVEWVAYTCRRWKVDTLLIEAKANGISVAQEMIRLYGDEQWTVQLEPVKGDKVARAYSVVPTFSQLLVHTPADADGDIRDWAAKVITEMEGFPKLKHDDLTDSTVQAIKHLRSIGLIQTPDEQTADSVRRGRQRPKAGPLYPV